MNKLLDIWLAHYAGNGDVDGRKTLVHYRVRDNLLSGCHKSYRHYFSSNPSGWLGKKFAFKMVGGLIGNALRDGSDDLEEILDYLNDDRDLRSTLCWGDIINNLFSVEIHNCSDCNRLEHEDNMHWAYDDYRICDS